VSSTTADVAIIASLGEPFVNLAESITARFARHGLSSSVLFTEAILLSAAPSPRSAFVVANDRESWRAAAAMEQSGTLLLNGDPRICSLERRHWKATLSANGVQTPTWISAATVGALMSGVGRLRFPAYLKCADHGRALVRYFTSAGDLSEYLENTNSATPLLLESAIAGDLEKAYVIGDASTSFTLSGGAPARSPYFDSIATRVQELCGLRYFSFDVISGPDGPFVIDINRFPVYRNDGSCWDRVAEDVGYQLQRETALGPEASTTGSRSGRSGG
jgi:hypothetical protein